MNPQDVFTAAFLMIGVATLAFPKSVDWVNARTNEVAARWWAQRGHPAALENADRNRRFLRVIVPAFFLFIGAIGLIDVATR